MSSFIHMQDDIGTIFKQIKDEKPIILFGHSMGGGLVTNFVLANPDLKLAGVILSAPFYRFPENVKMNYFKRKVLKFIAGNVPEIVIASKLSVNAIVKTTEPICSALDDVLFNKNMTLATVNALIDITLPLKQSELV